MNTLVMFYLMTSAIFTVPLAVITLSLHYDASSHIPPKMLDDRLVRRLRKNGVTRFEQLYQILNVDTKEFLTTFSLIALLLRLLVMFCITMAEIFDVPIPFLSNFDECLAMDDSSDFLKFFLLIASVQLIPLLSLAVAFYFEIPLPFMSRKTENYASSGNVTAHEEENSDEIVSIRLTRFENSEGTLIRANCHDNHLGELFEVVVCQGKEEGAKPECFLFTDDKVMEPINPAPVGVSQLNQILESGEDETTV